MRFTAIKPQRIFVGVGHHALALCEEAYEFSSLMGQTMLAMLRKGIPISLTIEQFYRLIWKSLPLVLIAALSTGAVMAMQFGYGMARFGGQMYVPTVVAVSFVRALGPIFTCLMVSGRVGAGIAAELGSMKVTQQVDALRALGTDPIRQLVVSRIFVLLIGVPLLTLLADLAGILGGMGVAAASLNMSPELYWEKSLAAIKMGDIIAGTLKTGLYGAVIGLISCFNGLRTTDGTVGIGQSTTKSVVMASLFVMLADVIVTKLSWIIQW